MSTVRTVLEKKSKELITISPEASLYEAARVMATRSVGALPVVEKETMLGIISERDILRLLARRCEQLKDTKVKDVMTTEVIVATPEDSTDYLMGIVTENKIRHIPVLENGKLIGIISIGDLVKNQLHEAHYEIHYLHDFIAGTYPR
ncbi:MAG: CBS domain-containing protein [Calditrichaeota bacterium]|nr:CBS domain-containing protein [Calditrichota bacterium]